MKIAAIIQARMSSSRLPGKVLLDIGGEPMLARVVERTRRAKTLHLVGVATTVDASDDAVEAFCHERGYPVFRGSQFDVLDRYYQAAKAFEADVIVRLTADCPVMDPALIDLTVQEFLESGVDFAATRLPPPHHRTYPIGLDIEMCRFEGLERAWKEATQTFEREHVMPYFYDVEDRFKIKVLQHSQDYGWHRWTVDTPADLDLLRQVYARFNNQDRFSWEEIIDLFQREPDLIRINADVRHKIGTEVDDRAAKPNSQT